MIEQCRVDEACKLRMSETYVVVLIADEEYQDGARGSGSLCTRRGRAFARVVVSKTCRSSAPTALVSCWCAEFAHLLHSPRSKALIRNPALHSLW